MKICGFDVPEDTCKEYNCEPIDFITQEEVDWEKIPVDQRIKIIPEHSRGAAFCYDRSILIEYMHSLIRNHEDEEHEPVIRDMMTREPFTIQPRSK